MGRIKWDVKDCMQSRQAYIWVVKKKKKKRLVARKVAQEVRQRGEGFAELKEETFWLVNTLTTCAKFRRLMRRSILVWSCGGTCSGGDILSD